MFESSIAGLFGLFEIFLYIKIKEFEISRKLKTPNSLLDTFYSKLRSNLPIPSSE